MDLHRSPDYQTSFESVGLSSQEKSNLHFQDGGYSCHVGFPVRTILVTFTLQVTWILPIGLSVQEKKFKIDFQYGLSVQEKKFKIDFQYGGYGDHR